MFLQRHAFYPRRGRQRCTLRHVIPLYNVHTLFTICVISPIAFGALIGWFIRADQSERRACSRFDYFKRKANSY
ncbi:hypothetical protein SFRURICE_003412 [Spodoptera frugiperda]|nr:hypothetical protein SFRURICE_003412 [Spodoptera frugiperda]